MNGMVKRFPIYMWLVLVGASFQLTSCDDHLYEQGLDFSLQDDGNYAVSVGTADLLSSITIPSKYKGKEVLIKERGFQSCFNLKNVTISDGVTSIGSLAFAECTSLISVMIPESVSKIGEYSFSNCHALENAFYKGRPYAWFVKMLANHNDQLRYKIRYYSETKESSVSYQYWHYVDGIPTLW